MKNKIKNLPIQIKITVISIVANLIVFAVNLVLLISINVMSSHIDTVYQANLQLNELSTSLTMVQKNMTEYLSTKNSDSLENYYRSVQEFENYVNDMDTSVTSNFSSRMERSIRNMSLKYIDETGQTIEAKRGRNVEKYRVRYEETSTLFGYINTMINSLNIERFKENSDSYRKMVNSFKVFESAGNIIMVVIILVNTTLLLRLTAGLLQPLKTLTNAANEVSDGNFDIEPLTVVSNDEIGVVTATFNQMVSNIRGYVSKIKESAEVEQKLREKELMMETQVKDAQLKYLQAQINPHFLFNTLNAGAQLAMLENADRTYEYVQNMAEFFRYNVKKGYKTVTIREELELVSNYIYILNVRFSGEIHYFKEVDESLLDVEMPSMILQPIVENCVNHGIREMMGEGKIIMKVYSIENTACISIEDNGVGMDEETIRILNSGESSLASRRESGGIGMDNVISRLRLFEGTDDVMSIESDGYMKGSKFTIYLEMKNK